MKIFFKSKTKDIGQILLEKSLYSFHFSLKMIWILNSELQDQRNALNSFRNELEMKLMEPQYHQEELKKIEEKQNRLNYFNEQCQFFHHLTNLSSRLRDYPIGEIRNQKLRFELERIPLKHSKIYFPFLKEKDNIEYILQIQSSYSTCFSTKERVPYLIVVETLQEDCLCRDLLKEGRKWKEESILKEEEEDWLNLEGNISEREKEMNSIFGIPWNEKKEKIRKSSIYGHLKEWNCRSFIVKCNDDLRLETLSLQLLNLFKRIFDDEKLPIYIRPYEAIILSNESGLLETLTDSISLDGLKKKGKYSLLEYFQCIYEENEFKKKQNNFVESLTGYSLFCYLMEVKDRHNGNIMIDRDGHLFHIDYGFFLGDYPGGSFVQFENAPFKLTSEYVELMGGVQSDVFINFRILMIAGFQAIRRRKEEIMTLVRLIIEDETKLKNLDSRFQSGMLKDFEFEKFVHSLIDESNDHFRTRQYDNYQKLTNGIL
jgi:phosphatidylinositol 4-kinase B